MAQPSVAVRDTVLLDVVLLDVVRVRGTHNTQVFKADFICVVSGTNGERVSIEHAADTYPAKINQPLAVATAVIHSRTQDFETIKIAV